MAREIQDLLIEAKDAARKADRLRKRASKLDLISRECRERARKLIFERYGV